MHKPNMEMRENDIFKSSFPTFPNMGINILHFHLMGLNMWISFPRSSIREPNGLERASKSYLCRLASIVKTREDCRVNFQVESICISWRIVNLPVQMRTIFVGRLETLVDSNSSFIDLFKFDISSYIVFLFAALPCMVFFFLDSFRSTCYSLFEITRGRIK